MALSRRSPRLRDFNGALYAITLNMFYTLKGLLSAPFVGLPWLINH